MGDTVFVYKDEGAHPTSYRQAIRSLRKVFGAESFVVKGIDSETLIHHDWQDQAALLVIGGGRDVPYHNKLRGEGNRRIRSYVEEGGCYLGLCAGGYYGTAFIDFDEGGSDTVTAARELAFFPDAAIGPAYKESGFRYDCEAGAVAASIEWLGHEAFPVTDIYFNGGCYFRNADKHQEVEVVARYADLEGKPAAIVQCKVEKGRAILSGVHPEFRVTTMTTDPYLKVIAERLEAAEPCREQVFSAIVSRIIGSGFIERRRVNS